MLVWTKSLSFVTDQKWQMLHAYEKLMENLELLFQILSLMYSDWSLKQAQITQNKPWSALFTLVVQLLLMCREWKKVVEHWPRAALATSLEDVIQMYTD